MSNSSPVHPAAGHGPADSDHLAVARALAELRQGREIDLTGPVPCTVAALESLLPGDLAAMRDLDGDLQLLLSPERVAFLNLETAGTGLLVRLSGVTELDELRRLAGLSSEPYCPVSDLDARAVNEPWVGAALTLAKQARLAPALLVNIARGRLSPADRLQVSTHQAQAFPAARGHSLERVSAANDPLAAYDDCQFIQWRERFGDLDHLAIVVGKPNPAKPVLIRLHSSCLTGDLFASLRCDCGEQLQGAIKRMAAEGGGVLLYLSQEGRGIGLVNKLRAYQLQDRAHDTLEADRYLGFRSDERDYSMACEMLRELGISKVRVLTNNPIKLKALTDGGIEVLERVAINIPSNPVNDRYIRTKRERAGHLGPETPVVPANKT